MQAPPFRIKVCGLSRKEDVAAAVNAGADAVGFVLVGGPRKINAHEASILALFAPPDGTVKRIALISNSSQLQPRETKWFDYLQIHGEHSPAGLKDLHEHYRLPLIRALPANDRFFNDALAALEVPGVAAVQVDAHVPGMLGGTGQTVDWDTVATRPDGLNPLILAGGLNAGNVAEAIQRAHPAAVDASSGLEASPAIKDPKKIALYVEQAKSAFALP